MSQRIPQLDGLRAVAILAVFVGHALKVRMMWMGVDLFFVLSGFLITGILLDTSHTRFSAYIGAFYARRVRRILPPYGLILLVVTLLFGTFWLRHWPFYFGLMNYVEFHWRDATFVPLAPLWSLAVEEQFYFFWPLVVFFVGRRHLPRVLVGLLLLAPLLRALATPWASHQAFNTYRWFIYKGTPFRMDCLAAGALLTFAWRAHSRTIRRWGFLGLVPVLLTPPLMLFLGHHFTGFSTFDDTVRGNVLTYEVSLIAVSGLLLWALGGRFTGVLCTGPMRWLARLSYSFYLVHEAALELVSRHLHHPLGAAAAAACLSLVYAELSWRFLERPILHGGNRWWARREVEAAQPSRDRSLEATAALRMS